MTDPDRQAGPTFPLDAVGFIDFETKSAADIRSGSYRYATEADAIVLAYAIGGAPASAVSVSAFPGTLTWADMPEAVQMHHERVKRGEGIWAAWNAGFDRPVWNYATPDFPLMEPHHIIDVMAQATASGLPPDLAQASRAIGGALKVGAGKDLVKLFCLPGGLRGVCGTPQSHPEDWEFFVTAYATGDIDAMRDIFKATRQLPLAEWKEYWAMEAINDRGVGIDVKFARAAAKLAQEDKLRSKEELWNLTDGAVASVDQVAKMVAWLMPQLLDSGRAILTKREEEVDEEGVVTKPAKYQLTRKRIERLLAYIGPDDDGMREVYKVLQIRQYGGSKTPAKFQRMLDQQIDGVLYGQYVFNGAPQTGRASSKGVQIHNLARDTLKHEAELIDAVTDGISYDQFSSVGDATPVARKLSLLIRPTFVPRETKAFVWSDWSNIEARVLPWLADYMPGARARVQIFRDVDADPSIPDLYTRTAAQLSKVEVGEVTKPMRQRGKVTELALGFCGGVGALQAMGAAYGLHISDDEARETVDAWRAANPWAQQFARDIWDAMLACRDHHGQARRVGRIWLKYEPGYLGGSLLARLPSGRCLTYRQMHWQDVDVLDEDDKPTGIKKRQMMFSRGYGRLALWPGMFVENFTQATAADVLRGTLVRLEDDGFHTRLHTHDEVLCEPPVEQVEAFTEALRWQMQRGFSWSDGLPLMSEEMAAYSYTKDEKGHGL